MYFPMLRGVGQIDFSLLFIIDLVSIPFSLRRARVGQRIYANQVFVDLASSLSLLLYEMYEDPAGRSLYRTQDQSGF
jgi:hypothetical protein